MVKGSSQHWSNRLWRRLQEDGLSVVAIALILAFLFPLQDFRTIMIQLVSAGVFILVLTRFVTLKRLVMVVIGLAIFGLAGLGALLLAPGRKYVVPVELGPDLIAIREIPGPDGAFLLVPTHTPVSPKRWLLAGLAALDDRIVMLEPRRLAEGYLAHSPTEIAARELTASSGANARVVTLPFREVETSLLLNPANRQLDFNFAVRSTDIILRSDVSTTSPGLFGIATSAPPDLESWQRLAFAEEFLRSLTRVDSLFLLDALRAEADRTGRWGDRLRMLVFRLHVINTRFRVIGTGGNLNFYELATLGNLRSVADEFNAAMPTRELQNDPWLRAFVDALLLTTNSLPDAQLYLQGSDRAPQEIDWLVRIVRRLAEVIQAESLQVPFAAEPRVHTQQSQEELPRTIRGLLGLLVRADSVRETEIGEIVTARALIAESDNLNRPVVIHWVEAAGRERGRRVALLQRAKSDAFGSVWAQIVGRMMENPARDRMWNGWRDANRMLRRHVESLHSLLPLVSDPDQRRLLAAEQELDVEVVRMMSGADRWGACERESEATRDRCVLDAMTGPGLPEFAAVTMPFRAIAESDSAIEAFVEHPPPFAAPYSPTEAGYLAHLALAFGDLEGEVEPRILQQFCELVANHANALIVEGRIDDRASVLALQAETLGQCGRREARHLERLLVDRQLSLPSWRGRIFDSARAPPSL